MEKNKTDRKNKTGLVVKYPSSYFTIEDLNKKNSDFINITLRVRLNTDILEKKVVEIGTLKIEKGRPKKIFSLAPVSEKTLQSARNKDIITLHDCFNTVKVAGVEDNTIETQPSNVDVTSVNEVKA